MKYIEWPAHRSLDWEPKDEEEYTKLCSGNSFAAGVLYCMDKLEEQAKEAETKGEWKWKLADNGWADYTCSVCGYTKNVDIHVTLSLKYCPNCGSRMKIFDTSPKSRTKEMNRLLNEHGMKVKE